jgi:hypothetical protein
MNALVVYESMYGNTRAIAEAVGVGLGDSPVRSVQDATMSPDQRDLVVVGGPTHMHGLATALSRRLAAEAAKEDGHAALEPGATAELGLRGWLRDLAAADGIRAAAFDTRLDRSPALTGAAARGIARRLRGRGYDVIATESFLVEDAEGPLADGELERARAWGEDLGRRLEGR